MAATGEEVAMTSAIITGCKYLGAGICMGLGAIGPGIGECFVVG